MIIYILNIVMFWVLSYCSVRKGRREVNAIGEKYIKPNKAFLLLSISVLFATYVFRGYTGTDSGSYISGYRGMHYTLFDSVLDSNDVAFNILCWVDYHIFGGSVELHYIILGIITYMPIMYMYIKYSESFSLSGLLYILTTGYYFAFNGQRQAVAVGICIIAIIVLIRGNWKLFVIAVLIASRFHSTALFMIPVAFLAKLRTTSKLFVLIAACLLVSAVLAGSLWDKLFDLLGFIGQDRLVEQYAGENNTYGGANILRVLVLVAPIVIGGIFYKDLSRKNKIYDFVLNLNIIGAICMIAGTSNWLFARLAAYTSPFIPMLITYCGNKFEIKSKIIYYSFVIVLYFIYMWVYVHADSNLLPYKMLNGIIID